MHAMLCCKNQTSALHDIRAMVHDLSRCRSGEPCNHEMQ